MNKAQRKAISIFVISLCILISLLLVHTISLPTAVYAEQRGSKTWTAADWKKDVHDYKNDSNGNIIQDLGLRQNWGNIMAPLGSSVTIHRESLNTYYADVYFEMGIGGVAGVGYWNVEVIINNKSCFWFEKINGSGKYNLQSEKVTINDNQSLNVSMKISSNYDKITRQNTMTATFSAYDTTKPSIKIDSSSSNDYFNHNIVATSSDTQTGSSIYYRYNSQSWKATNQSSYTFKDDGEYEIKSIDGAGNQSGTIKFYIDKTKPTISLSDSVENGDYTNKLITCTGEDANFKALYYKAPAAGWQNTATKSFTITDIIGTWQFYIEDLAGNRSETIQIDYDNVLPVIGLRRADGSSFADNGWSNQGVYFDVSDNKGILSTKLYKLLNDTWQEINSDYINGAIYFDTRYPNVLYGSRKQVLEVILAGELEKLVSKEGWETIPNDNRIIAPGQIDFALQGASYWEYTTKDGDTYVFFIYSDINAFLKKESEQFIASQNRNMFLDEGSFKVIVTDIHGNISSKLFNIKLTLPELEVQLNGYTNQPIHYSAIDNYELKTWVKFNNGDWILQSSSNIIIPADNGDGTYFFKTMDIAGNLITATVVLDTTMPIINIKKNGQATASGVYINASDRLEYFLNDINAKEIWLDGQIFKSTIVPDMIEDGEHVLVAFDLAGNRSEQFIFIVDKIIPTIELISNDNEELTLYDGIYYTNKSLFVECADTNFAFLCVYKDNQLIYKGPSNFKEIESLVANFGNYKLQAEDKAGNIHEKRFVLQYIDNFGNKDIIFDTFKINAWYEVTLPGYVFGVNPELADISGKFTFERYEDALNWTKSVEELYRVKHQGLNKWIYVSATNEAVSQVYTNRADLDKVIIKYATRYISRRKVSNINGSDDYYTIKDANGITDMHAFTRQLLQLPAFLSDYSNLSLVQVRKDYVYKKLKEALSPTSACIIYLADDYSLKTQNEVQINYSKSIGEMLNSVDALKQGYYLVEETDLCGNIERYIIYLDLEAPKLLAEVERGDSTRKELVIDNDYVDDNAGVLFYLTFEILRVFDNADSFINIRIDGRGVNGVYVLGDDIPILNAELGGGQYILTIYDRSGNVFICKINIATREPTMEYNSLKPTNRQLTLFFKTNDLLNNIIDLKIYKLNGSGEHILIERDDLGVYIDFTRLEYNFTTGGKYMAVMVDRYGRTITTEPVFYERGLPQGNLSIANGSTISKDVTFSYFVGNSVVVYRYDKNGNLQIFTNYIEEYDNINKLYTLTFLAMSGTEEQYMIHLYNESDDNLFMEYQFGIDNVVAQVEILDLDGKKIEKEGFTNKSFKLNWTENDVMIKYSIGDSATLKRYEKNNLLFDNGLYTFYIKDRFGNEEQFTIFFDNAVEYIFESETKIININGKYISKSPVAIIIQETYSEWVVQSNNDINDIMPGSVISKEGIYSITIADRFGNRVEFVLEIDMTAPELNIDGVPEIGITNTAVTVTFEIGARCMLVHKGNVVREVVQGEIFKQHGSYELIVEDIAGNQTCKTFSIDLQVLYSSNVINKQLTTEPVTFALNEEGNFIVKKDGKEIEINKNYKEIGKYEITATDIAGNIFVFNFEILPKNARALQFDLENTHKINIFKLNNTTSDIEYLDAAQRKIALNKSGRYEIQIFDTEANVSFMLFVDIDNVVPNLNIIYNKNNTISFSDLNKTNVTIVLTKDGKEIKFQKSMVLKDPGHYVITLIDEFGNSNKLEFEIQYKLNTWAIVMIVLGTTLILAVTAFFVIRRLKLRTA